MRTYGQFCPVAKAAEILAAPWTLLIVRELLVGSRRFNDIRRGLPRISRTLLVQRLRALEDARLLERRTDDQGRGVCYELTTSGRELMGVIRSLGEWGQRWLSTEIDPDDIDPTLLMWDIHRRIHLERLPPGKTVIRVDFRGARRATYWLVLEPEEASVCEHDPGFEVGLYVDADTVALHRVWLGHQRLEHALGEGLIRLDGPTELVKGFPGWLALSVFADVPQATGGRD